MLPLKDNIPTDRLPILTLLLVAASVTAIFLPPDGGTLQLLASALFLWIFGTNVEDSMSRIRFIAFCAIGGAAAAGLGLLLDRDATVEPIAAAGAAATVLGGYIRLYPRARVVSATLVPFAVTLVEVPAWVFVGAWFVIQAILAALAPTGPHDAVAFLAQAVAFAYGVLAIRVFAQRHKLAPPPSAIAALS